MSFLSLDDYQLEKETSCEYDEFIFTIGEQQYYEIVHYSSKL